MSHGIAGVAVVTGAAGGIGAEITRALADDDTAVALLDRDGPGLWRIAEELSSAGVQVLAVATDVTDSAATDAAVDKIETELGPVGYLVNAAGVLHSSEATGLSDADWDSTLAVNAGGVFHTSRSVARRMVPRRSGSIVTVGSNASTVPRIGLSAYAASKAAAAMFTRCLGLELAGHGIRCNVVAPGSTRTPMLTALQGDVAEQVSVSGVPGVYRLGIPLGRIAEPAHIADAVLFLLSDRAAHITMQHLTVDGGAALGA
jgi:2,3-dihydro-2,3-dihydroxybenzoate dehydrogenase